MLNFIKNVLPVKIAGFNSPYQYNVYSQPIFTATEKISTKITFENRKYHR